MSELNRFLIFLQEEKMALQLYMFDQTRNSWTDEEGNFAGQISVPRGWHAVAVVSDISQFCVI